MNVFVVLNFKVMLAFKKMFCILEEQIQSMSKFYCVGVFFFLSIELCQSLKCRQMIKEVCKPVCFGNALIAVFFSVSSRVNLSSIESEYVLLQLNCRKHANLN